MSLSRETRDLARRLLDYEAAAGDATERTDAAVIRVCENCVCLFAQSWELPIIACCSRAL